MSDTKALHLIERVPPVRTGPDSGSGDWVIGLADGNRTIVVGRADDGAEELGSLTASISCDRVEALARQAITGDPAVASDPHLARILGASALVVCAILDQLNQEFKELDITLAELRAGLDGGDG